MWGVASTHRYAGPRCASPDCPVDHASGSRFCEDHREELARIRSAMEDETDYRRFDAGSGTRGKARPKGTKPGPICCLPTCYQPRSPGERFCVEHSFDHVPAAED
jgi:hypothetical protein